MLNKDVIVVYFSKDVRHFMLRNMEDVRKMENVIKMEDVRKTKYVRKRQVQFFYILTFFCVFCRQQPPSIFLLILASIILGIIGFLIHQFWPLP